MSFEQHIINQGRHYLPQKLRSRLIAMVILMVSLPTLAIRYFFEDQGYAALIQEKKNKLIRG